MPTIIERERRLVIRIWAAGLGFALAIYGGVSALRGLGRPGATAPGWCAVWLCPEEFSGARESELLRQSAGGGAGNAVAELKRALVFDSASAYRWADLGEAFLNTGDPQKAGYSFSRAVEAGPRNPAILMRAANFWFSIGDRRKMMQYGSAILRDSQLADYYTPAFLLYARAGAPIEQVLAEGIPPSRMPAQAFLRFLMEGDRTADAAAAWKWIAGQGFDDSRLTGEYVSFLLRKQQGERAAETWAQVNPSRMRDYRRTNWVYNGSFEAAPQPSPLDWQIEPARDVDASRIPGAAHAGRWALQLVFNGAENIEYHGVGQQAVLAKGRWHTEAFIRTQGITTDKGIGLHIFDPANPQILDAQTACLTGTMGWTKVEKDFDITGDAAIVRVEILREPSLKFDNKIAGTAWIDSIKIDPVD